MRLSRVAGGCSSQLDEAVFAASGWPVTITDAELLERPLALNHERAASESECTEENRQFIA
jgi:hypothetical protein